MQDQKDRLNRKLEKSSCRVQVYSDTRAFVRLAETWNDLVDRDEGCTVFQTWTWVSNMWGLEKEGRALRWIVVVYDTLQRVVALAPMLIERILVISKSLGRTPYSHIEERKVFGI